jgi:hypothetical protein
MSNGAERQRIADTVTWLIGLYGPDAATEALHHALKRERDGDSIAAQFFIEVYRAIAERRP